MDRIICYVFGLGLPKLFFYTLKETSEYNGASAITSRLKDISLRIGMEEGISVLILIGIASFQLTAYCFKMYYKKKIIEDKKNQNFKNKDEMAKYVMNTYPISNQLKFQILEKYYLPHYK